MRPKARLMPGFFSCWARFGRSAATGKRGALSLCKVEDISSVRVKMPGTAAWRICNQAMMSRDSPLPGVIILSFVAPISRHFSMRIITRVMRLSDLRTDVQVQYEDAVGNVHRAVITCAKRGLRAKTLLPDGGYTAEHALYATNITRILGEEPEPGAPDFHVGDNVSVSSEDFQAQGVVIRQLDPDEFEGDGARCYAVRLADGTPAELFDYEMARI
jgi:hypothetical protein